MDYTFIQDPYGGGPKGGGKEELRERVSESYSIP